MVFCAGSFGLGGIAVLAVSHRLGCRIDVTAQIAAIRLLENNHVIRFAVPPEWLRYIKPGAR
jgi:hypothetical protein